VCVIEPTDECKRKKLQRGASQDPKSCALRGRQAIGEQGKTIDDKAHQHGLQEGIASRVPAARKISGKNENSGVIPLACCKPASMMPKQQRATEGREEFGKMSSSMASEFFNFSSFAGGFVGTVDFGEHS